MFAIQMALSAAAPLLIDGAAPIVLSPAHRLAERHLRINLAGVPVAATLADCATRHRWGDFGESRGAHSTLLFVWP